MNKLHGVSIFDKSMKSLGFESSLKSNKEF
jgi:hypothetical protein